MYCPIPYFVLLAVLGTSFSIDGSLAGVKLMFTPNVDELLDIEVLSPLKLSLKNYKNLIVDVETCA